MLASVVAAHAADVDRELDRGRTFVLHMSGGRRANAPQRAKAGGLHYGAWSSCVMFLIYEDNGFAEFYVLRPNSERLIGMLEASTQTAVWIAENWRRVQAEIAAAAEGAGRSAEEVLIIGVSKYVDIDLTEQLVEAGCTVLGENRPQNLWNKADALKLAGRLVEWHLIGHLQRNKIRRTLPQLAWLHSLDSIRLAEALNTELETANATTAVASAGHLNTAPPRRLNVLLEVNVTQDASKTGMMIDGLPQVVDRLLELPYLQLGGLMAMSSRESGGDETRREFAAVRQLRDELQLRVGNAARLDELSMGMSGDYREAIAEGATMVRIGSSLWQNIM